ncbi:TPA: hypothetical protein ACGHC7_003521, partial [Acinetobacter baumannii]
NLYFQVRWKYQNETSILYEYTALTFHMNTAKGKRFFRNKKPSYYLNENKKLFSKTGEYLKFLTTLSS